MKHDGLENVHTEAVMVPRWVRGRESAEIVQPAPHTIAMLGLGDSIGTPPAGIEAEALVVRSFQELDANAAKAKGRIVVFNVPYTGYGETRRSQRTDRHAPPRSAPSAPWSDRLARRACGSPHTGGLTYSADAPKIPAAAIASEDADRLQRMPTAATDRRCGCRWRRTSKPTRRRRTSSARSAAANGRTKWSSSADISTAGTSAPVPATMAAGASRPGMPCA